MVLTWLKQKWNLMSLAIYLYTGCSLTFIWYILIFILHGTCESAFETGNSVGRPPFVDWVLLLGVSRSWNIFAYWWWTGSSCSYLTLPETNIAPENGWLEYYFSFWDGLFSGAMLVSGRVHIDVEFNCIFSHIWISPNFVQCSTGPTLHVNGSLILL